MECPIYIRRFNVKSFEYLTVINNEIYTMNIDMKPNFIRRILYPLGLVKDIYSKENLTDIVGYFQTAAKTTIETILNIKK